MIPIRAKLSWTRLQLLLAVAAFGLLLMANALPTSQAAPLTAPTLTSPVAGVSLDSMGAALTWQQPQGTTQFQIQVTPAKSPATGEPDGPGINLIIGDAASVAKASFLAPEPVFGQGPYVMLPGMTYTWRVRVSDAKTSIGADDPSWSPWSEEWTFRARAASSGAISLSSPAEGLIATTLPTITWKDADPGIFYYEVQLSADPQFRTGSDAVASVFWNLVHGGESLPPRSWTVPSNLALPPGLFYWRVRPRIQGDGTPVGWGATFSFRVPVTPGTIVINEVMPIGSAESAPWAELVNHAKGPVPLGGAMLTDEDGNRYTFPGALPNVPVGAFVLVYFDGQESGLDDYDFSDGKAVLHSTNAMISPFEVAGDQLALYSPANAQAAALLDFVAWGIDPTVDAASAVAAGLWTAGTFLSVGRGGDTSGEAEAGESLGILPGQPRGLLKSWTTYRSGETTPG